MLEEARALEAAGCFALVLEMVPAPVAAEITRQLSIPVIGIGAGVVKRHYEDPAPCNRRLQIATNLKLELVQNIR